MSEAQQPRAPAPTCAVIMMSDRLPCGRPIYHAPGSAGPSVHCIMHCRETTKDPLQFRQEIDAILGGTSTNHRPKDGFDFTGFVFFEANFSGEYFTQNHDFSFATFTQKANFFRAVFTKNANVNANSSTAHFIQHADFSFLDFAEKAPCSVASFTQNANFSGATFTQNADFRGTEFRQPELVRFRQVNQKEDAPRLRARFVNCRVEAVQFADVNWHRPGGRLVLQDELDLTDPPHGDLTHELVAIAYRQLVSNFEKERAYDLAEECKIGAMEMKRLDPKKFLSPELLKSHYKKWRWLCWLGENISVASLYRWTSRYGTSYTRALLVLLGLLVFFGLLFALPWAAIQRDKQPLPPKVAVVAVPSTPW